MFVLRHVWVGVFALFVIGAAGDAYAKRLHHTFDDWRVFTYKKGRTTLCYVASVPTKKAGNYSRRGEPFALVTFRKGVADEVSVSSGYPYNAKKNIELKIDGKKYKLFAKDDRAWAKSEKQDRQMADAMRRGSSMTVKGTSRKGTYSSDTYSLKGFTKAVSAMRRLCR